MFEKNKFLEEEIPYGQFLLLGIDHRTLLSMPKEVLEPLVDGRVTPVIQGRIDTKNGYSYRIPLKLQLVHDAGDQVQLMTYPLHKKLENTLHLNDRELERVSKGEVIHKEFIEKDDTRKMRFVQLDSETQSLMYRDMASVKFAARLKDMEKVKDIELGTSQKEAAREGKLVELNVGNEKVTVGVDLHEPQGFKVVNGDMEEWKRQTAIRYDIDHPEVMGYVQTDRNRWEYQQLQLHQTGEEKKDSRKKEEKESSGLKR